CCASFHQQFLSLPASLHHRTPCCSSVIVKRWAFFVRFTWLQVRLSEKRFTTCPGARKCQYSSPCVVRRVYSRQPRSRRYACRQRRCSSQRGACRSLRPGLFVFPLSWRESALTRDVLAGPCPAFHLALGRVAWHSETPRWRLRVRMGFS